jgi:hypothetical protein
MIIIGALEDDKRFFSKNHQGTGSAASIFGTIKGENLNADL